MKKIILFILLLCYFVFIPSVNATTDEENISTTTTTTTIPIITTTTEQSLDDTTTTKTTTKTTKKKTSVKVVYKKNTTTTTKKITTTTTEKIEKEDDAIALSETEIKSNINKATILVEAAEKSLLKEDYDVAFNSVNKLNNSNEKEELVKRLQVVNVNITAKEICKTNEKIECEECKECNNLPWIVLCAGLFICLVAENVYLVYKNSKMYD